MEGPRRPFEICQAFGSPPKTAEALTEAQETLRKSIDEALERKYATATMTDEPDGRSFNGFGSVQRVEQYLITQGIDVSGISIVTDESNSNRGVQIYSNEPAMLIYDRSFPRFTDE
jgi:hypothetical protein